MTYSSLITLFIISGGRYVADKDGFRPEVIEEVAPVFDVNPESGTSRHTVSLPFAEEYGVEVTAEQLKHYQQLAQQQAQA